MFPSISASTALPSFTFWSTLSYLLVFCSYPDRSSCSLQPLHVHRGIITFHCHDLQACLPIQLPHRARFDLHTPPLLCQSYPVSFVASSTFTGPSSFFAAFVCPSDPLPLLHLSCLPLPLFYLLLSLTPILFLPLVLLVFLACALLISPWKSIKGLL